MKVTTGLICKQKGSYEKELGHQYSWYANYCNFMNEVDKSEDQIKT